MHNTQITLKYLVSVVTAVFFTWLLHEFAHWITYLSLGYEAIMRFNKVIPINESPTLYHAILVSASGPLITIFQAFLVFIILQYKRWNIYLYPFLLAPFYMRFLAGAFNYFNPNDEGRISQYFGIGLFTLSIIVSLLLFYLVYNISKKYQLSTKFQLATLTSIIVVSSFIIMIDQVYKFKIL